MAEAGQPGKARGGMHGRRGMLLPLAALWLLLLAGISIGLVAALPVSAAGISPSVQGGPLVGNPNDTPTPTDTVTAPTATPSPTPTHPGRKNTPTPTRTPTQPPVTGGGGGGSQTGGGNGPQAPQPTKVVLAEPTAGSSDSPLQGLSLSDGANGVWIASIFGCITALLGILVAAVALSVLVRGGYGPFLRAMVFGKRASARGKASRSRGKGNWEDDDWARAADDWDQPQYGGFQDDWDGGAEYRPATGYGRQVGVRASAPRGGARDGRPQRGRGW